MREKDNRYFLDQDESCHWYIIPEQYREAWDMWAALDSDTEEAWDTPKFAQEIGGHPNRVTFTNPEGH